MHDCVSQNKHLGFYFDNMGSQSEGGALSVIGWACVLKVG